MRPTSRLFPILTAGFAAFAALTGPAKAQSTGNFSPVVIVNDSIVTRYELDQRIRFLKVLNFPGDLSAEAETGLIEDRLRSQAAKDMGVTVTPDELNAGMAEFAGRANLDTETFLKAIAQGGVDPESFRDFVRSGLAWRNAIRARFASKVDVSEAEVDRAVSADSGQGDGPRVLLSEIFIPARQGEVGRITTLTKRLKDTMKGEADFARAAKEKSVAASRADGGRVNWIPLSNLPPQVRDVVTKTSQGQITDPVQMPGYVGLFLVRGMSQGGKVSPAAVAIDYAALRLPAGASADAARIAGTAETCDDLYALAKGGAVSRQTQRRSQIGGATGAALDKLDAGESTVLSAADGTLTLLMLCSRNATLADGPIPPKMTITYPAQPVLTADGDVVPAVVDGVGLGLGVSRDQVREDVVNRKVGQMADAWLAELQGNAIITKK
jgi:peptidyl-prolyl cis-trans isomerase SurA